jgi:hypothetical protein
VEAAPSGALRQPGGSSSSSSSGGGGGSSSSSSGRNQQHQQAVIDADAVRIRGGLYIRTADRTLCLGTMIHARTFFKKSMPARRVHTDLIQKLDKHAVIHLSWPTCVGHFNQLSESAP